MADFPAAMSVGPRASGKTTTASRFVRTVVRLDRPAEAQPFTADPDVALAALRPPVLLDEWQLVPSILAAWHQPRAMCRRTGFDPDYPGGSLFCYFFLERALGLAEAVGAAPSPPSAGAASAGLASAAALPTLAFALSRSLMRAALPDKSRR